MHANMLSANIPAYRKIRSVRCIWLPLKCSSRIFILEIWKFLTRREEEQGGGRLRFQSSPEGQVRILVWNIPPLYFASIKDVIIITPISSLPLSSPLPSASIFFILSINPPPFSLLFCQMCFSLVLDETESVGLIIPDQSFELCAATHCFKCTAEVLLAVFPPHCAILNEIMPHCVMHEWILMIRMQYLQV